MRKYICRFALGIVLVWSFSHHTQAIQLDQAFVESTFVLGFGGEGATWDGNSLWISDPGSGTLKEYDISGTPNLTGSLSVSSLGLGGLTWDGNFFWDNTNGDTYRKISPIDGSIVDSVVASGTGSNGGLTFDGQYLWKASRPVYNQIDPVTGAIINDILGVVLPGTVEGLTIDGTFLYSISYTGSSDPTIWKIDVITGTLQADSFALPTGLYNGLAWDGASLWAVNFSGQTLIKISVPDPTACSSDARNVDDLVDEVFLLETSTDTKEKLLDILENMQVNIDNDQIIKARKRMKSFIDRTIIQSNLQNGLNQIEFSEANALICSAANVLAGILPL